MVVFNEKSYAIEAHTGCNPVEDWLHTVKAICIALGCENGVIGQEEHYRLSSLLYSMLPDYETAKKMFQ